MRSSTFFAAFAAAALASISSVASSSSGAAAGQLAVNIEARELVAPPARSRHATRDRRALARKLNSEAAPSQSHVKKSTLKKRQSSSKKCKAKSHKSSSSSSSSSGGSSSSSDDSTGETIGDKKTTSSGGGVEGIDFDPNSNFLKIGNIYAGFLPDDGSGGGQAESMAQINAVLPAKSAFYGRYAQVTNGKTFDGSQLYHVMDDIVQSGAILQASVMPYKTWYGLTESDNRNAVAVAKVCNDIYKKHGVEVWLRFAHEMNWYQTDGTYSGSVQDFQTGWKVMSDAIAEHAPETKMYWSPNVGSDADYEKYYPKEGKVDIVGFDWYPNSASDSFVDRAKKFHDKYAVNGIKMFQGETGLHYTGSDSEKMQWVNSLSSKETQDAMPNYLGWLWFNYDKFDKFRVIALNTVFSLTLLQLIQNGRRVDFKIIKPNQSQGSGINSQVRSFFSA